MLKKTKEVFAMDVFVVQLRKAMFLKGWKQVDLANATGYRDGKVSAWYNGKYRAIADQTARDRASIALYFANNLAL